MATLGFVNRKDSKNVGSLGAVISYSVDSKKTKYEDAKLISGVGCMPKTAIAEFGITKKLFGKEDGRQFYYMIHSFEDEMVDPVKAHQMAIELVEQCYPDHQAVVTTHTNTDNIHSHIIINSVNSVTGKKINQNKNTIEKFRKINDDICRKYGTAVCEPKNKPVKPMNGKEYYSALNGESWKIQLCIAINNAMEQSKSKEKFIENLNSQGYEVDWADNHKYITYKLKRGEKYLRCRDNKLHDEKYLKENMELEFKFRQEIIAGRTDIEGKAIQQSSNGNSSRSEGNSNGCNSNRKQLGEADSNNGTSMSMPTNSQRAVEKDGEQGRSGKMHRQMPSDNSVSIRASDSNTGRLSGYIHRQEETYRQQGEGWITTGWEQERKCCFSNRGSNAKTQNQSNNPKYDYKHSSTNNIGTSNSRYSPSIKGITAATTVASILGVFDNDEEVEDRTTKYDRYLEEDKKKKQQGMQM